MSSLDPQSHTGLARGAGMWVVLLASVLVLAGCGGDDDKEPSGGGGGEGSTQQEAGGDSASKDPCSLLTDEEVTGALGGPSEPPVKNESPSGGAVQVCSWFPQGGEVQKFVQVSVSNYPGGGKVPFDATREASPGAKDVSGVGDAAYSASLGGLTKVSALTGETVVDVTSLDEASATELAKAVLERLS